MPAAAPACASSSAYTSSACAFAATSTCPGFTWPMSMNATQCLVLDHLGRRNLAGDDLAEHAVGHDGSPSVFARRPIAGAVQLNERAVVQSQRAERSAPDASRIECGQPFASASGRASTSARRRSPAPCASGALRTTVDSRPAARVPWRRNVHAAVGRAEAHARHRVHQHAQTIPAGERIVPCRPARCRTGVRETRRSSAPRARARPPAPARARSAIVHCGSRPACTIA